MKVNLFYYSYSICKWNAAVSYGLVQHSFYASVVIALVFQVFIVESCLLSFIKYLHTGPAQGEFRATANLLWGYCKSAFLLPLCSTLITKQIINRCLSQQPFLCA